MDGGAWWAAVQGDAKSQTHLKRLSAIRLPVQKALTAKPWVDICWPWGTGWTLALGPGSEGGCFYVPVGLLSWEVPGLGHSHSLPPPTGPARRDLRHRAQRAEGELWSSDGEERVGDTEAVVLSRPPYVCARETLALLGLRDWQESPGPQAFLDPLE